MGTIRSVESLALAVLRLIGEETRKDRTSKVIAQLPVDVANYLLNEKREWIRTIEARDNLQIVLIANPELQTPNYSLRRVRDDQSGLPENSGASYKLLESGDEKAQENDFLGPQRPKAQAPAVGTVLPSMPAPPSPVAPPVEAPSPVAVVGLMTRLKAFLFGSGSATPPAWPGPPAPEAARRSEQGQRGRRDSSNQGRNRGPGGDRTSARRTNRPRDGTPIRISPGQPSNPRSGDHRNGAPAPPAASPTTCPHLPPVSMPVPTGRLVAQATGLAVGAVMHGEAAIETASHANLPPMPPI